MYGGIYRVIQTQGIEKDDVRRIANIAISKPDIPESVHKYGDVWPPQGTWNLDEEESDESGS